MASLDFIENTLQGYRFVWRYRGYLLQNAIAVIFIKTFCLLFIFQSGITANPLREGLFLMPSHVIEGFFLINLLRFCLYREPIYIWGKPVVLKDTPITGAPMISRAQALKLGVGFYLLVKVVLGLLIGLIAMLVPLDLKPDDPPTPEKAILSLVLLSVLFWGLRLLWVYIPAALGVPIFEFFRKISGFHSSLYFLGVVILSSGPLLFVYAIMANVIEHILENSRGLGFIMNAFLQSFIIVVTLSIQTVAFSLGVSALMSERDKS